MVNSEKLPLLVQRIDKWLWTARFFKTRSLATAAIHAGHIKLNGSTVKPARELRAGDTLEIAIGDVEIIQRTLTRQDVQLYAVLAGDESLQRPDLAEATETRIG